QLEVVSAVFDPATRTWGPITQLTNDEAFDTDLQITSDSAGHLLLTWLSNPVGSSSTVSPNSSILKHSFWNGSGWSSPTVVASGIQGVTGHSAAISGGNAFIMLSREPDPNVTGTGLLEVYRLNGSNWSAASTFASTGMNNRLPSVVYDARGEGHIIWVRGN